jgi:hypothetical protein
MYFKRRAEDGPQKLIYCCAGVAEVLPPSDPYYACGGMVCFAYSVTDCRSAYYSSVGFVYFVIHTVHNTEYFQKCLSS